jgi:DNA-binding CsgD family transcriptional regulator/tetratricopeptide (TPR) repeat protein
MELIERASFLALLQKEFETIAGGEGHCVLLSGEAGIGKTSLVKAFCKENKNDCRIYQGTCDALFTPRPLAPLYDIIWQLGIHIPDGGVNIIDRSILFARFLHELGNRQGPALVVFEDIHWADEATIDFIKFLARRITHIPCLFILTYRDEDIHGQHPLRNLLGQLPPDSFTRLHLPPLSRTAVEKLAVEKGYSGEDVYSISGGNPFYVNEILASYSPGVPDNIKDSILSVYQRQDERTKQVWEILSVIPTGFEIRYLEKMEPYYASAIDNCMDARILVVKDAQIFFKHELYRRTIETSLSPFVRIALNKRILDMFLDSLEQNQETERIIHHAKNANEYDIVVHYAPLAAKQAACVGAHTEASRLYYTAIEYYQGSDKDKLIQLYESYAYECYLTNRIKEAIIYQGKSLNIRKTKDNNEKIGNCMWFLSRLWWFDGNHKQAENYAGQAIEVLDNEPSSKAKGMAFSNMSQMKMLADNGDECIFWGQKAIDIAKETGDEEILSHALNNMGTVYMRTVSTRPKGKELLQQSLDIALKNSFHEHAARAYTNMVSNGVKMRDYPFAKKIFEEGIQYCEERDLGSWSDYMTADKAKLHLKTGAWEEALRLANNLVMNGEQAQIVKIGALTVVATIKMRRGDDDALSMLLEAKAKASETMELQRIVPILSALLEYEWLNSKEVIEKPALDYAIGMVGSIGNFHENNEFVFWLAKTRRQQVQLPALFEGFQRHNRATAVAAAAVWEQLGCPYEQAFALFEGNEADKRSAISIVHTLGATAVYEKMKLEMRNSGIKSIPRGIRKTTQSNAGLLTQREVDVLQLVKEGMQNKEIAARLFISAKTVDHHISAILFKLDVKTRFKAVQESIQLGIIK